MEILEAALPRSPLIAGATSLGAYLDETGALHASARGPTRFASWRNTEFRWAEYAATLFEGAGLTADASRDANGILWRKLALNAAVNPISALSGRPNGAILESRSLLRVAEAAARFRLLVDRFTLALNPGSHHMNVFRVKTLRDLKQKDPERYKRTFGEAEQPYFCTR